MGQLQKIVDEEVKTVSNYYEETFENERGKVVTVKIAITDMWDIWVRVSILFGNRLHRVGAMPFYVMDDGEVRYIKSGTELFGLLFKLGAKVRWSDKVNGAITKSEFYQYVGCHATAYDMIATLPHFPPIEGVYYSKQIEPCQTRMLDQLIDKINYATPVDRVLLKACFMTPFWGGPGGSRPAFLLDGEESDEAGRRGIGKTTITDVLSQLCGDAIDISNKTDGEDIKKRLLGGGESRMVRLDNVKSTNFSNEAIESLITIGKVSGHRMYVGQSTVMNWFTFIMTFNDACLSKDMAQRTIIIRLKRPQYDANWETDLRAFVVAHRDEIIADIGYELGREVQAATTGKIRFPYWEKMVLSKACNGDLDEISKRIKEEQDGSDTDDQFSEDIKEVIESNIYKLFRRDAGNGNIIYFNPEKDVLGISKRMVCEWVRHLFANGTSLRTISKKISSSRIPEIWHEQKVYRGDNYYIWRGGLESSFEGFPKSCWRICKQIGDRGEVIECSTWQFD